jgi:hypothetical protein
LRTVDSSLYQALVVVACHHYHPAGLAAGIQTLATVIAKHVATWFCTTTFDNTGASRLADVFLVSHPLMPVYVAVAMLTVRKRRRRRQKTDDDDVLCFNQQDDLATQLNNLFQLSSLVGTSSSEQPATCSVLSEVMEEVITTAISYMCVKVGVLPFGIILV